MTGPLLGSLLCLGLLAAAAPFLSRAWGRNAGYALAAGYLAAGILLAVEAPHVLGGGAVVASWSWMPSLGIHLTFLLDGLSLTFGLLICGVGALVMAYAARYFPSVGAHGRIYGLLTLFAASMLGLVLAGDLMLLFIFWELTSITSFFLIGGVGGEDARGPALRALLVTGGGGLALFAGFVLLGVVGETFDLPTLLSSPGALTGHALAPAILALVLIGAFTKSAQFPFHFWLPGAMVAPTPVSTYLHAATMVKAGIYLLARFTPLFNGMPAWRYTLVLVGLGTSLFGATLALKQYDLKALLAYSTVSQLGFIVALVGIGTPFALAAATLHTIAHAGYKATLFMVVGIIDREAGSRDLRNLSGLRRAMPATAAITGLAALSMAGFPPFLGFISKEAAFDVFLETPGAAWFAPLAATLAVASSVMTFAYGARIFDGTFEGPLVQRLYEPARSFLAPAAVTALAGIALGLFVPGLDAFITSAAVSIFPGTEAVRLALWHGFTPALVLSVVTIGLGLAVFFLRRRVDVVTHAVSLPASGASLFDAGQRGVIRLGSAAGRVFLSASPARHVLWLVAAVLAGGIGAWVVFADDIDPRMVPPSFGEEWAILALVAAAAAGIALARTRIAAVALLGLVGFLVAVLYVLLGGPDLALTQLLVETLTVVLVVLVFRRLPATFKVVPMWRRAGAAGVALVTGVMGAFATYQFTGHRPLSEAGEYFLESSVEEAGGGNVVNAILVDFRALDTLGEITVLAVAAMGVFALVRVVRRDNGRDPSEKPMAERPMAEKTHGHEERSL